MPPLGSARNRSMRPSPLASAVTCPPGVVLPSETGAQPPQVPAALRETV